MNAPLIQGPLAEALKRGRDRFNTKFAYARRRFAALDTDAVKEHLRLIVAPIAEAVHASAADRVDEVIDALYDLSLELLGGGLLGRESRYPALGRAWREMLPRVPHLVAREPARLVSAITNAIYNLSKAATARPTFWLDTMTQLGTTCGDVQAFLEAGKVVAWRSGLAEYRDGALAACLSMDEAMARAALGLADAEETHVATIIERLRQDRWLAPAAAARATDAEKRLRVVAVVGAFRGFGGVFVEPPRVLLHEGEWLAYDREACWLVTADLFGATFHRAGQRPPAGDRPAQFDFKLDRSGHVMKATHAATFAQLADASSSAATDTTLAVTLPRSHSIYFVALSQ
ncbi:MAG TPA: hypothetical protein VKA60_25680 [Blastocatellia bacterium]|nr:hypothetical protein [Blastocatellia bacterium]